MKEKAGRYEIRLKDHVDEHWEVRFEGMKLWATFDDNGSPVSLLSGLIADQSQLHSILTRIRDAGMTIISIIRVDE